MEVVKRGTGTMFGSQNAASKLTEEQVLEMRKLRADGFKVRELAKRYNIAHSTVSRILNGKAWVRA